MGDEATGTADGPQRRRGSTGRGSRAGSPSTCPGVELPLSFERISGGHSNLTYGVSDAAGRRWALRRPPLGKRLGSAHDMGREHKVVSALGPTDGAGGAGGRALRGRERQRRALLRDGVRRGADPARPGGGGGLSRRGGPAGDRRARRRHPGRDPRGRPRRGRARRPRPQGGLRRPPAAPLARPVGEVEDARAGGDRRGARAPGGAHPRAGPGDDRPRRLPARQHDPLAVRGGRRGGRLGALHARRPARRRRPADGLLAAARARTRSPSASRPTWRPASPPARS